MIEIDGSYGEGGGQVLRTALGLSCLFRKPFRIYNIRKGRRKPGLMPQHLTAVRAAQLISDADVGGDDTGSTELSFSPGEVRKGDFFFDIGTAGSTSLVLQTLIPAVVFSRAGEEAMGGLDEKTTITLKGGTHVPLSPPFNYLEDVFISFLRMIGIRIVLSIESYGFYPKGGGKVRAEILPVREIIPLRAVRRGKVLKLKGYSGVGNLPLSIAERQRDAVLGRLFTSIIAPSRPLEKGSGWGFEKCPVEIELQNVSTPGQGTFVFLQSEAENSVAGFTSLGERGKKAEVVGAEAATGFLEYYSTNAALDPHMSDQIVIYLSMCPAKSEFTTSCITGHLMTNLWAISLFHGYRYSVDGEVGKPGSVMINPGLKT